MWIRLQFLKHAWLAAVVFHDVHQLVMTTATRGHKVLNRIQRIEATLPLFEKAVHEQNSHIHFAYIAGCDWHTNIQTAQSQLPFNDLPEFMLDSYEECRDPPRLNLLDKFDSAGAGACLKRYSDPSYFRMFVATSDSVMVEKANNGMKVKRTKKQRSNGRSGLARHSINMTLHGRSNMLVTDELSFSVDDASVSDTLSIPGFTIGGTHLSSDQRTSCLEVQNARSSMSKELYDGMSATDVETAQKDDCIFTNGNKVTASDYPIQDLLHQKNDPSSSFLSFDEKTEMVMSVNQMLSHDIPEDRLNKKAAGLSSSLSNRNHSIDGLGTQGGHISRSLTWDESSTDSLGAWVKTVSNLPSFVSKENATGPDKSVYSIYSTSSDEDAEIIEFASSKFPDGIIPCRPPDSDLLFVSLEMLNQQNEMNDTEMHKQENVLSDTSKMDVPSKAGGQVSVLTSQLDKHMDAINALDSKVQTNFVHRTGEEVLLLPHLNYNGMECEINKSLAVTTPGLNGADSEIAHEPCASRNKKFSRVSFDHLQSSGSGESSSRLLYVLENAVSKSQAYDGTMKISEKINSAPWVLEAMDRIPPEGSMSQDSIGNNSAKTVSEKVILYELQTKQEKESTVNSNILVTESHSSLEKVTSASKLDFPDSDTHVSSCSSSPCPGVIIPSTQALVFDGIPPAESLHQNYFYGTSAKTNSEKELFCECQTKQVTESIGDSNCQGNEYQSNMEKMIPASNLDDSDSETNVTSLNRACCPGFIFPNSQAVVNNRILAEESLSKEFSDTSAEIATEKEALCEHQTKLEIESMDNSNCQGIEYQITVEKVMAASKFDAPNSVTYVASRVSSDAYASPILCNPIISSSVDSISSSTLSSDVTLSRSSINIDSPKSDIEDPRGYMSAQLTNKSVILASGVTAATTVVSHSFPADTIKKSSVNIWTNGGLLGLEPSKPPDINVPNAYGIYDDSLSAKSQPFVLGSGNESRKLFLETDKLNRKPFPEQDNIMGEKSGDPSDSMLSKQRLKGSIQASLFCEIGKAQNAYLSGTASEIDGVHGGTISSEAYIYSKNVLESIISRRNSIGKSVGFSSLAHRFLVSSLQRKSSMNGIASLSELMSNDVHKLRGTKIHSKDKERPKPKISSAPLHKLGNKEDFVHGFSEKLVSSSLDSSGYQSPPLEHMEISFQPMNDSDVSKLNLEFFSSQQQGKMENMMYPSLQLLPESCQPLLDGGSDSDDDTFCRSCPYSSDDLLTLHSESDAEIWVEDERDISYIIEAADSISSTIESNACNACRVSQVNDVNLERGSDDLSFNSGDIIDRHWRTCNPSMQQTNLLSRLPDELQPPPISYQRNGGL